MKLRSALALLFLTSCYRDLDVPDCAHTPQGCVDSSTAADADAALDDTSPVIDSGTGLDDAAADTVDSSIGDAADSSLPDATEAGVDALADACSTMTCTVAPAPTCASATARRTFSPAGSCSMGICSYPSTDTPCATGEFCSGGVCSPRSCAGGLSCGASSCCDSVSIPAGTFPLGRGTTGADATACSTWASACDSSDQPQHSATVSAFRLDTFEVTVGRFRKFVADYPAAKPTAGAGAHPRITGSGWQSAWDAQLPATRVDLMAALKSDTNYTWTDTPGSNELKPINAVDWYISFAFCAWDGGRLPTEAEWEYAAAGGSEDRVMPWGNSAPTKTLANYGCTSPCGATDIHTVGSHPLGAGRWGQQDLTGNLMEWTLDWWNTYPSSAVTDPAYLTTGAFGRVARGGSFMDPERFVKVSQRFERSTEDDISLHGVRCARNP